MFDRYYQTELTYLREMGAAFARTHPGLAGMLAERGGDPDVERLLEGFAFLAGRIHQRIDDSIPEFVEGLAEHLGPHLLRPVPACTVVQFERDEKASTGRTRIAPGTRLLSRRVRGTECEFRTAFDVDLLPLRITHQRVHDARARRPRLVLGFAIAGGTPASVFERRGIDLYIQDERGVASHLAMWLRRHLESVTVRAEGDRCWRLPEGALEARAGTAELWPWPALSPPGLRRLVEYFTLPSHHFFFRLGQLGVVTGQELERFEVMFDFDAPPPLPVRPAEDAFRLHCVPAANVFQVDADPIRWQAPCRSGRLRAQGLDPMGAEVFSVDAVESTSRVGDPEPCASFYGFRHGRTQRARSYYVVSREASPVDDGVHHSLRLQSSSGTPLEEERIVSCRLTCTNRSLPRELGVGDVVTPTASSPTSVSFRNITAVSPPVRAPLAGDLLWRTVAYAGASPRRLGSSPALKSLLSLHNVQGMEESVAGRANEARIEAIRHVRERGVTRICEGAPVRGAEYRVELDETSFESLGEAWLFGEVLAGLLQSLAPINSFADLVLQLFPSEQVLTWNAKL